MAKFFTLEELTASRVARQKGIDNTPGPEIVARLETLAQNLLDPVREMWGAPIRVNSGYRCEALNRAVGGAARSQHLAGEAADITTGTISGNKKLFEMVAASGLEFDQLIDERGYSWLHVSYRAGENRNKILHL